MKWNAIEVILDIIIVDISIHDVRNYSPERIKIDLNSLLIWFKDRVLKDGPLWPSCEFNNCRNVKHELVHLLLIFKQDGSREAYKVKVLGVQVLKNIDWSSVKVLEIIGQPPCIIFIEAKEFLKAGFDLSTESRGFDVISIVNELGEVFECGIT